MFPCKYVILKVEDLEYAIVFNGAITHNDLNRLKVTKGMRDWHRGDIIAGGFVHFNVKDNAINLWVSGRSESANVDSRPEDVELIATALGIDLPTNRPKLK